MNFNDSNNEMRELIIERKGGLTSVRIIDSILEKPANMNQIAKELGLSYKTVKFHAELLIKLEFVQTNGRKYGKTLYPSPKLYKELVRYNYTKRLLIKNCD